MDTPFESSDVSLFLFKTNLNYPQLIGAVLIYHQGTTWQTCLLF